MKDFFKTVFSTVFSFGGFFAVLMGGLFYLLVLAMNQSAAQSKACVLAGMVKVQYDSTSYCAAPSNLVGLK